ncbi:hypothetical protein NKJ84_23835 [Mesorhizobium sp. M0048]|uniref:hypothetical protein n=1 Tax=Mesorhizobium sp. M0048 TaxID=2956860 RepID=UPI00333D1836
MSFQLGGLNERDICATRIYSVAKTIIIFGIVIEDQARLGMFAAEKGERCEPFSMWGEAGNAAVQPQNSKPFLTLTGEVRK